MPWRSASASLPVATTYSSLRRIKHAIEVVDVGAEEVVRRRGGARPCEGDPKDAFQAGLDVAVGGRGDPGGRVGVRRAAAGRVVLEAAVARRVVRGRDDDPVGKA